MEIGLLFGASGSFVLQGFLNSDSQSLSSHPVLTIVLIVLFVVAINYHPHKSQKSK